MESEIKKGSTKMKQNKIKTTRTSSSNKQFHIFFYKNFMCFLGLHSNGFWWIEVGNTCVAPIICNTKMDEILYQPSYWHLGYLCYKCVCFVCFFGCFKNLQVMMIHLKKKMCIRSGIFLVKTTVKRFEITKKCEGFSHHFKPERLVWRRNSRFNWFASARFSQLPPSRGISRNTSGQRVKTLSWPAGCVLPFCQEMAHEKPSFFCC